MKLHVTPSPVTTYIGFVELKNQIKKSLTAAGSPFLGCLGRHFQILSDWNILIQARKAGLNPGDLIFRESFLESDKVDVWIRHPVYWKRKTPLLK